MSLTDRVGPKEEEKKVTETDSIYFYYWNIGNKHSLRLFVQNTVGYMIKIVFNTFECILGVPTSLFWASVQFKAIGTPY